MIERRTNRTDGTERRYKGPDNVAQTTRKPREYRRHPAVTDMIDKANAAMEQNRFQG